MNRFQHVFIDATVLAVLLRALRNATMVRTKEAAIYKETHQGYTESIQAIMKATRSLKAHRTAEAVSLLTKLPPAVNLFARSQFLFQRNHEYFPGTRLFPFPELDFMAT